MSSRKIWSIPIAALALVLMLAGALVATSIVQAQTPPSARAEIVVVSDNDSNSTVKVYEIINFDATAHAQNGTATITDTVAASGDAAAFAVAVAVDPSDATKYRVTVSSGSSGLDRAQGIYEITVNVPFDSDIDTDAADDGDPATTWDGDDTVGNDEDLVLSTMLTVYVPGVVDTSLEFTVDSPNVIIGDVLSAIGRDLEDDPQTFVIENLGPAAGSLTVDPTGSNEHVTFHFWNDNEILVRAAKNGLADGDDNSQAIVTVPRGDHDLDEDPDDTTFTLQTLDADINDVASLEFADSGGTRVAPDADGIHYTVVIPEDTENKESVLPFFVAGVQDDEQVTGIIDGPSAGIFRVNNAKMAIEYSGATGDLVVGDEHVIRLTATGDSGLKNRLTVGMVKIIIANVDDPPAGVPDTLEVEVDENVDGPGLVEAETLVHDFADVGSDPEGIPLTYSLKLADDVEEDPQFAFDGTKLVTNAEITDGNETFERTVIVSDGVIANDQEIAVTITVDVNEPVALKADAVLNADGEYEFTPPDATEGVFEANLLDLNDIFENDQPDDEVTYSLAAPTADGDIPEDLDINGDQLVLMTVTAPETGDTIDFLVRVNADDNYNNQGVADATVILRFTVTVVRPVARSVGLQVVENAPADFGIGTVDGILPGDSVGESPDITYELFTASSGADVDFSLDENTGEIKVVNGRNYENESPTAIPLMIVYVLKDGVSIGQVSVTITVMDVNEAPMFATPSSALRVNENEQPGADVGGPIMATDPDGDVITFSVTAPGDAPFKVVTTMNDDGSYSGQIQVDGETDIDDSPYMITVTARDDGDPRMSSTHEVVITLGDINDAPVFDNEPGQDRPIVEVSIPENAPAGFLVATYNATDPDGGGDIINGLEFVVRYADDVANFSIANVTEGGEIVGVLTVSADADLEYDIEQDSPSPVEYTVEVNVCDESDTGQACNEIALVVTLENSNDETPVIGNTDDSQDVPENSPRGTSLGDYGATDKDNINAPGFDTITYTLEGTNAKSFQISDTGELMTLESLDYDRPVPCRTCNVTVVATDEAGNFDRQDVTISVTPVEDSVSTLGVTKANPVPGTSMGNPMSALAGTKTTMDGQTAVMERPGDLPATMGDAPMNFVDSDWANWGTVLRIEIIAESPGVATSTTARADEDGACGDGNQCVIVKLNSDSGDDTLHLRAYRSASQEDKFVAAVMLVEYDANSTDDKLDIGVYLHDDGMGVPRLSVDEEDEVEIEFGNLRASVDVENEAPEIGNFNPAHEMAFDDADVDYTFTITDAQSGLPEPEDLPDRNGDGDYMPVVALISKAQNTPDGMVGQCELIDTAEVDDQAVLNASTHIHETDALYCPGSKQEGEYVASDSASGTWGFAPIRDDKDFDEIGDGYDVETTIVLTENQTYYVTFIVCDNAGNCAYYDPDGNDDEEELAEITVDILEPEFVESRTGLTWDSTDNEYDDNRKFIQLIFNDLTTLNPATVEVDDFVVEGHSIKDVHVFENPDDDDVVWADSGRYAVKSPVNRRGEMRYRDLENMVFLELEDELLADETPEVTIVPNGVEDRAGNDQDGDGEGADGKEADDWISPEFTIVSITSTRVTSQDEVLAGEDDEVTVVVTSDERLDQTRPEVTVTYVNAPSGSVDTKGTDPCRKDGDPDTDNGDDWTGKRDRGEIVNSDSCLDSDKAKGDEINNTVEKVSNTEWIVTITEPDETGYYSFRISGEDRSSQQNPGSEGIAPADIVTDFFDSDGDVNVDDAVFFEGDKNLGKPNVRVSGEDVTDDEPEVEFRSPLFVELDFTKNHWVEGDCSGEDNADDVRANCMNENSEYAEDNFDDVVITMFELDGVDMTDSVKTTDDQTFLVSLENISVGDHTFKVQAMDQAGNMLDDVLEIDFEVEDRSPFELRLNPGWNLVSLPGEPSDSAIGGVFGPGVEVRTVYTYDPVVPGGWMVAVRETLDSDWQGDLTEISGQRGYWVLSDAIQDWEVSIPRLAGGAAGTGTPIQPPSIPLYAGWNLIPVTDITGTELDGGTALEAVAYLENLNDGIEAARVLGFNTIKNEWYTVNTDAAPDPVPDDYTEVHDLMIGSGYWVFVREATTLVPGQ